MLEVIRATPGLEREEVKARASVADRHRDVRKAIARATEQQLAYERPVDHLRSAPGLFPGPAPPEWEPGPAITAAALRGMRAQAALSVAELAQDLQVDQATIRGWEAGRQECRSGAAGSCERCSAFDRFLSAPGASRALPGAQNRPQHGL